MAKTEVELADAVRFFHEAGVQGSTTIYEPASETWYYTNRSDADTPTLPASTFKIINSLILLQEGVVSSADERIAWDGVERTLGGKPYPAWNRDHTLTTAFKDSAVWVYEALSKRVKRDTYRQTLAQIDYGNGNLDEVAPLFWLTGNFGVTPRQQIALLDNLYRGALPFDAKHQQAVRAMMASAPPPGIRSVAGKTGLITQGSNAIGWWCGWLVVDDLSTSEAPPRVLFFATRISRGTETPARHFTALRQQITYRVAEDVLSLPKSK